MADDVDTTESHRPSHREVLDNTIATEVTMRPQTVPINVYEAPEALIIVAPLPAVTPDDVVVKLRRGRVRFSADLRTAPPRDYLIHEWEYGGYDRTVDLPDGYGAGVEASLHNGQLVIRVRKGEPSETADIVPAGG